MNRTTTAEKVESQLKSPDRSSYVISDGCYVLGASEAFVRLFPHLDFRHIQDWQEDFTPEPNARCLCSQRDAMIALVPSHCVYERAFRETSLPFSVGLGAFLRHPMAVAPIRANAVAKRVYDIERIAIQKIFRHSTSKSDRLYCENSFASDFGFVIWAEDDQAWRDRRLRFEISFEGDRIFTDEFDVSAANYFDAYEELFKLISHSVDQMEDTKPLDMYRDNLLNLLEKWQLRFRNIEELNARAVRTDLRECFERGSVAQIRSSLENYSVRLFDALVFSSTTAERAMWDVYSLNEERFGTQTTVENHHRVEGQKNEGGAKMGTTQGGKSADLIAFRKDLPQLIVSSPGKLVAYSDGKQIAVGDSFASVMTEAREKIPEARIRVYTVEPRQSLDYIFRPMASSEEISR